MQGYKQLGFYEKNKTQQVGVGSGLGWAGMIVYGVLDFFFNQYNFDKMGQNFTLVRCVGN